jgi:hypothetical protein
MPSRPQLLYIAGYGRSGSTFLERLLHCQPQITACGEMAAFLRMYASEAERCSCGRNLSECDFWGAVAQELDDRDIFASEFPRFRRIQKKREAHWSHGGSLFPSRFHSSYAEFMRPFFEALTHRAPAHQILIDSSKTAYSSPYRPVAISQLGQYKVRVIHVVRDVRGVVWSVMKGLNRRMEKGELYTPRLPVMRAVAGWGFANRAAERLKGYFGEENYCLVRYEDLMEDPVRIIERISALWDIDLQESMRVAQEAENGSTLQLPPMHQLAGNRMRFSTQLSLRPDFGWKEGMAPRTSAMVRTVTLPLMKKYGYV